MYRTRLLCLVVLIVLSVVLIKDSAAKDIVIGGPFPMDYADGWSSYRGMQMAVDEINAAGGVDVNGVKRKFKLVTTNSKDIQPGISKEQALTFVEALIKKEKPDFIMGGPNRSEVGLIMLDLINRHKIIHIVTSGVLTPAYHKKIARNYDRYKYGFRITSHGGILANNFLNVTKIIRDKYGLNKVYFMLQTVEHAQKGGAIMKKLFLENGFEVAGQKSYESGTIDYSIGLLEAHVKDADIIFIWMDMPESVILLKQMSDMKITSLPIGYIAAAQLPNFSDVAEGSAEHLIVSAVNGGNAPGNITPWTMKFVNAYKKKWGLEPEAYGASSGYMAPYILKDAIERAGTIETEAVIKTLEDTDMTGVYGRIRFDKKSHQIISSLDPQEGAVTCIFQWQNDKRVQVYPPKVAQSEITLPSWMTKK